MIFGKKMTDSRNSSARSGHFLSFAGLLKKVVAQVLFGHFISKVAYSSSCVPSIGCQTSTLN